MAVNPALGSLQGHLPQMTLTDQPGVGDQRLVRKAVWGLAPGQESKGVKGRVSLSLCMVAENLPNIFAKLTTPLAQGLRLSLQKSSPALPHLGASSSLDRHLVSSGASG